MLYNNNYHITPMTVVEKNVKKSLSTISVSFFGPCRRGVRDGNENNTIGESC